MEEIELLKKAGGKIKNFKKKEIVFFESEHVFHYHFIISGRVKMLNASETGKEYVHGIFGSGESFGEPALFGNENYPATAIAIDDCSLLVLEKTLFFQLLQSNYDYHLAFTAKMCKRLRYKTIMTYAISSLDAQDRLLSLFAYLKEDQKIKNNDESYTVDLTRKEIAELTGLRIETVIRAVKKMVLEGKLKMDKRKIIYTAT
ncbi:MAG: Crp/Fnr family transcriptional regulator [Crocinitomicaceae bacterium]|nr:Crp/Fnr family transcriptional regulator [Crocinitomicaceae bacterium]